MKDLIAAVKNHARDHYDRGWDVVVETMTDADIAQELTESGARTLADAVMAFEAWPGPVAVWLHQLRETAWGGPGDSPY